MSTKISTELDVTRSSTRRIAPPGGASSLSFGNAGLLGTPQKTGESSSHVATPTSAAGTAASTPTHSLRPPAPPSPGFSAGAQAASAANVAAAASPLAGKQIGLVVVADQSRERAWLKTINARVQDVKGVPVVCEVTNVLHVCAAAAKLIRAGCSCVAMLHGEDAVRRAGIQGAVMQSLSLLTVSTGVPVLQVTVNGSLEDIQVVQLFRDLASLLAIPTQGHLSGLSHAFSQMGTGASGASFSAQGLAGGASGPAEDEGMPTTVGAKVDELRASLKEHGARGIVGLSRKFRIMDDDGSGHLNLQEFSKAMKEHGMDWASSEIKQVFDFFDDDKSGSISFDEFLCCLRGELNERRRRFVDMAFDAMDKDGSGSIDLSDVTRAYSAAEHPDVVSGKRTQMEILREFLDTFDAGEKDGIVTRDEFYRYYGNVSASIDDDDYFELMIRNAWHISGGKGWCENTTCRRVLVTHSDGTQTVEEVQDDLGVAKDDKETMKAKLEAQGIDVVDIELSGSTEVESAPEPAATPTPRKKRGAAMQSSLVLG